LGLTQAFQPRLKGSLSGERKVTEHGEGEGSVEDLARRAERTKAEQKEG